MAHLSTISRMSRDSRLAGACCASQAYYVGLDDDSFKRVKSMFCGLRARCCEIMHACWARWETISIYSNFSIQ